MGLLLLAVLVTGYAMLVTRKRRKRGDKAHIFARGPKLTSDETDPELLQRVLYTVHIATRIGAGSGALALAALGGTAWVSLAQGNPAIRIDVTIKPETLATLKGTCPEIASPLRGQATAKNLRNKDEAWLSLELDADMCASSRTPIKVSIPKESVSLIVVKD